MIHVREVGFDASGYDFFHPDNACEMLGVVREGPLKYMSFRLTYVSFKLMSMSLAQTTFKAFKNLNHHHLLTPLSLKFLSTI